MSRHRPPKQRRCGTIEAHARLLEQYPALRAQHARMEAAVARQIHSGEAARVTKLLITIPVVVHVVYRTADENISDAQVRSQIPALNRDYRARNADKSKVPAVWKGLISNSNIAFALAKKDPSGKLTNGITRTQTTQDSFDTGDGVKKSSTGGIEAWPSDQYLNLWVCTLSNNLLGYAQFPGGPASTDGVVILNTAFGTKGTASKPFNLGRTATQEVGHWLNLHHIWGDRTDCGGTDFVSDTPNQQHPNYRRPAFPHVSCTNAPNGDMFMNYMDYVDDAAMVMFSDGQVARMNATIAGPRSTLSAQSARTRPRTHARR
jgi:Pregnancy-associated plasma protein-A